MDKNLFGPEKKLLNYQLLSTCDFMEDPAEHSKKTKRALGAQ